MLDLLCPHGGRMVGLGEGIGMRRNGRKRFAASSLAVAVIALACSGVATGAANASGGTAYVRVNQVGFPTASTDKGALLMSSVDETGATFVVQDATTHATAYSGSLGAFTGQWSPTFPYVYELRFGGLTTPGTYTISVSGPASATSLSFRIDTPAALYTALEQDSLYFFEAQRDGADQFSPTILSRQASHLNDAMAKAYSKPTVNAKTGVIGALTATGKTVNAMGAWHDAGDYLKFVETTSYTVDLMLFGVLHYPTQMGAGAGALGDYTAEAKRGVDWLLRMWDDKTKTLYYQVGLPGKNSQGYLGDHDLNNPDGTLGWRLPEADDHLGVDPTKKTDKRYYLQYRPVFRAAGANAQVSPNLAGRLAAAFALCYRVYHVSDPTFANTCLVAAGHIYGLAKTSVSQTNSTTASNQLVTETPNAPEIEWRDDLELGAAEMALAFQYATSIGATLPTGLAHPTAAFYLHNTSNTGSGDWAAKYLKSYYLTKTCSLPIACGQFFPDTLSNNDVTGVAHYELYRAMNAQAAVKGMPVTAAALVQNLHDQLRYWADFSTNADTVQPFEQGYKYDNIPTTDAIAAVVEVHLYDELPPPANDPDTFHTFAQHEFDYVFGANAWGVSFVVGAGSNYVRCLQSQVANINGSLLTGDNVLRGAIVGGGNSNDTGDDPFFGDQNTGEPNEHTCDRDFSQFNSPGLASFYDNAGNYLSTEPALNYVAPAPLAYAASAS